MSNFDLNEEINLFQSRNLLFGCDCDEDRNSYYSHNPFDWENENLLFATNKPLQLGQDLFKVEEIESGKLNKTDNPFDFNMTTNYTMGTSNPQADFCKNNLNECDVLQNIMRDKPDFSFKCDNVLIKDPNEEGNSSENEEMPSLKKSWENITECCSIQRSPLKDCNENSLEVTLMETKKQTRVESNKRKKYKRYTDIIKKYCMKAVSYFRGNFKEARKYLKTESIIVPIKYLKRWSESIRTDSSNNTTFRIIGSGGKAPYPGLEKHLNKFILRYKGVSRKCFLEEAETYFRSKYLNGVLNFSSGWINNFKKRCGGFKFVSKKECSHCKKD